MKTSVVALGAGVIFGLGLCLSEMINPARVIGFLDVFGEWDATLVFVMISAVAVTSIAFPLVIRRSKPVLAGRFFLPERTDIDRRLLTGAVLFGIGWGLAGLCPGPAIAALASMSPSIFIFVAAMISGQWLASRFE